MVISSTMLHLGRNFPAATWLSYALLAELRAQISVLHSHVTQKIILVRVTCATFCDLLHQFAPMRIAPVSRCAHIRPSELHISRR
jgi:hypothetical protein